MMSRIIREIIQNSLHQNQNGEDVKNGEIRYLPDLSIFNLLSVFVLKQRKTRNTKKLERWSVISTVNMPEVTSFKVDAKILSISVLTCY